MDTSTQPRRHLATRARRGALAASLAGFAGLTGLVAAGGVPHDSPAAAAAPVEQPAAGPRATSPTTWPSSSDWFVPAQPPLSSGGWGPPQGMSRGS